MPRKAVAKVPAPTAKIPELVTVGRIVHYVMPNREHRAAIVTATGEGGIEDTCELTVFMLAGESREPVKRQSYVPFDQSRSVPYSWHWPEREDGLRRMQQPPVPTSPAGKK